MVFSLYQLIHFMSTYTIVMQSSPVAVKKLAAFKAYAKKNGMEVAKADGGKVLVTAIWSEADDTFEYDLTQSFAKHLKEAAHFLMTIYCGKYKDGTSAVEALYFIEMAPSGESKRIAIELNDISGPWTKKSLWAKKAIDWSA